MKDFGFEGMPVCVEEHEQPAAAAAAAAAVVVRSGLGDVHASDLNVSILLRKSLVP